MADGDYTNHASVQAAADHGVDFYGSWQDSWRAVEHDPQGRHSEFLASAFPYDAAQDRFTCPAGQTLSHHALLNRDNGVRTHVYRAPKMACPNCPLRDKCAPQQARPEWRRSITRLQEPSATTAFKQKMATEEAKQIYPRRSQIAEFPHAWITSAAAYGGSAAEAASRLAWKPCGPVSATTSSAGSGCDRAPMRHC